MSGKRIEHDDFRPWLAERPFSYSINKTVSTADKSFIYEFKWVREDRDNTRRTKGTELKTPPMPGLAQQWAVFEFYAPADYFIDDSKFTIIMQYHSIPDFELGEEWRNPVANLLIRNGELQYDFRSSVELVTPKDGKDFKYTNKGSIRLGRLVPNSWNRVIIHQRFDPDNGFIKIWINGEKHERGSIGLGFNDRKGAFFKFGIYCPQSSDKAIKQIFFRNVRLYSDKPMDPLFPDEETALRVIRSNMQASSKVN